jgi:tRNA threonylcarbamoyladenosine modification (KEOPS) complex  Pcc1 subunit
MKIHLNLDADDLAQIKAIVDSSLQPLIQEITKMTAIVDSAVASNTSLRNDVASLLSLVQQLIALADADKAALVLAIQNSGISAADSASLQSAIDANTTARASIATAAQAIADTLVKDAPNN